MKIPSYPLSPTMQRIAQSMATRPSQGVDVLTRADMPKNWEEQVAKNLQVPDTLLLTKNDLALIKKVTGADIDYETGKGTIPNSAAGDFIQAIVDARYNEFAQAAPAKEMTASDVRDIFKNQAMANKPLDPNFLTEALKWFDDSSKQSESVTTAPPAKPTGSLVDQYA